MRRGSREGDAETSAWEQVPSWSWGRMQMEEDPPTLAVAVTGGGGRKWRVSYCRASAGGLGPPPWGCFPVLTWAGGPTCPTHFLEALSSTCRPSWFCLGVG